MTTPGIAKKTGDEEDRNEFHRAIALQYECVTDLLREFLDFKLLSNKVSLKSYINECRLQLSGKKYVTQYQNEILYSSNPDFKEMDVSTLTLILLAKCNNRINVTKKEKKCIENLREHRNRLAHNASGKLNDSKIFVETSNDIMDLSKSLKTTVQNNLKACIDELKQRACVRIHSQLEVLQFNTERLQVTLTYLEESGKDDDNNFCEMVLKFNLSRWAKQIARGLDMAKILTDLRNLNIFKDDVIQRIKDTEYECNKAAMFIEYLIREGSKIEILKCCKFLRGQGRQYESLADLIEGNNSDGVDSDKEIQIFEKEKLQEVLQRCLKVCENSHETCEAVHVYVEEQMDSEIQFSFLSDMMKITFGCHEKDGRFEGVSLIKTIDTKIKKSEALDENVNVAAMSFDEYAQYIGNQFRSVDSNLSENITRAIIEEAVQLELFVSLTDEEINDLFGHYLQCKPLQFGVKKQLQRLQINLKGQLKKDFVAGEPKFDLRKFDKPLHGKYLNAEVSYQLGGDLNVPAHEFIYTKSEKLSKYVIEKNTVRFISACLNARKSGTIHFGIRRTGRDTGHIVGFDNTPMVRYVDKYVVGAIDRCFGHLSSSLRWNIVKCTRPAQIIQIKEEKSVVVEIDVVPFHKHLLDSFYTVMFPPCGPQTKKFFLYKEGPICEIIEVESDRVGAVTAELDESLRERQLLDDDTLRRYRSEFDIASYLVYELTRGADFITDEFFPIICLGSTDNCENYPGFEDAFQNSCAVIDFGSSQSLRKKMEKGNSIFRVQTVLDLETEEKEVLFSDKEKPWIYCNGNDDTGIEVLDGDSWTDRRMNSLDNILRNIKTKIPRLRAKLIFLAFDKYGCKAPIVTFAREAFIRIFKHECIFIGETAEVLEPFENEISRLVGKEKLERCLFSGLTWFAVAKVFRKTFKESSDATCKIPNSCGTYDEISHVERERWKDLDILSLEECINDEKQMKANEIKMKQKEEETRFYQGKKASWWNFHYGHHGERDLFSKLRTVIENKLTRMHDVTLVESVEIKHEPGAGGSILGRHLIWHFSQSRCSSKPYRCCVVKQITENTVREIEEFRQYKDNKPRPVIILLDDEPDGNMYFQKGLQQLAYKTASPGELFGIVINVSRVSLTDDLIEEANDGKIEFKNCLKHLLTKRERIWFENKYKELEKSDVDVNTLIAFNVMRNSFDKEYIRSTVDKIMSEVTQNETDILKVLSLVCTYEIGTLVPNSIFDAMVGIPISAKPSKIGQGKLFGLRQSRGRHGRPPEILNSKSLSLFVCRAGYELKTRGLRIISQPLAEIILRHIQEKQNLSLEDIVLFIIGQIERQSSKENTESKRFIEVVCSLFKTREDSGKGRDGMKDKFSRLIVAFLDRKNTIDKNEGIYSVVRVMYECFNITGDAFVGQQLARFHIIHTKDFKAAEQVICDSIEMCQNNSYLLDTKGQVFKTHMEFLKETNCQHGQKMSTEVAKEVITLAFKALDIFEEGQSITQEYEREKCNLSCYHMEVRTLVGLLEMFELFECFTNTDDFIEMLTNPNVDVSTTCFAVLNENFNINEIVIGGKRQSHAADALRFVEERDYQVKKFYTIYTYEDVLLLSLRERYERFYRSHGLEYQLKFGYGLKPLMKAMKSKDQNLVRRRYLDAKMSLEKIPVKFADTRDILFFVSYKFIKILTDGLNIEDKEYRKLLSYSTKLLDTQRNEKRPYLETFLFYAIFHWPLKERFKFDSLSKPSTYISLMELWEETYLSNNFIKTRDQMKTNKGKTYFALSKDHLGVIDLFEIEMEWREKKEQEEGRSRMHVYKDYFWREPFVAERLQRLMGTLDDSGTTICHTVAYPDGNYEFMIKTFYPCAPLRNRQVTFVLAFTWSGLRAFDVVEKCENLTSNGKFENGDKTCEPNDFVGNTKGVEQLQRVALQSVVEQSVTRQHDLTSRNKTPLKLHDVNQKYRKPGNGTRYKDIHLKPSERTTTKFGANEKQQSHSRQVGNVSQKKSKETPSDILTGQPRQMTTHVQTSSGGRRASKESLHQENDDSPLFPMSQFPELAHNTTSVETKRRNERTNDMDMNTLPLEEKSCKQVTQSTRLNRIDYASVTKGIKDDNGKGAFKTNEGRAIRPFQTDRDLTETKCFDKNYWDQLQKEALSCDWYKQSERNEGYGGLDDISLFGAYKTHETVSKSVETVLPDTKDLDGMSEEFVVSKKKKKKKKKDKLYSEKQYFDEID